MWFIADIIERYATGMAKTIKGLAGPEAAAEPNPAAIRARRQDDGLIVPDREEDAFEAVAVEAPAQAPAPVVVAAVAEPEPTVAGREMPMGVRGDVVVKWVRIFAAAERREMADLVEKLRKDKKVRVAELQMICVETLGETPQIRKKGEHLAVLRGHFAPVERHRTLLLPEVRAAAN